MHKNLLHIFGLHKTIGHGIFWPDHSSVEETDKLRHTGTTRAGPEVHHQTGTACQLIEINKLGYFRKPGRPFVFHGIRYSNGNVCTVPERLKLATFLSGSDFRFSRQEHKSVHWRDIQNVNTEEKIRTDRNKERVSPLGMQLIRFRQIIPIMSLIICRYYVYKLYRRKTTTTSNICIIYIVYLYNKYNVRI